MNFSIKTLGCKVNQYESQAMRELLINSGLKECLAGDLPDVYIINTCTVTGEADKESRYSVGHLHKMNPSAKIVVTGCYAEENAEDISALPGIFAIIKNSEKSRIAEFLTGGRSIQHSTRNAVPAAPMAITDFKDHTKAFVKIQDGCENFCSYCKVPLVRGELRSRPLDDIVSEVRVLVEKGFHEIVLTGICLGAWGKDLNRMAEGVTGLGGSEIGLVDVLKELQDIRGDFRIRLSSIEPKYVTDELIDFISKGTKVCRHLHIPLQSGDDGILRKMNRPYTAGEYMDMVGKLRARIDGIALATDLLIGFPGESEDAFYNTLECVKRMKPVRTHIFTFSKRKGTVAYDMEDTVSRDILKRRYYKLKVASFGVSYLYRAEYLKKAVSVLVETKRDKDSGFLTGYSDNYIKVEFEGPDELMRKIVPVRIEALNLGCTIGKYEPKPS